MLARRSPRLSSLPGPCLYVQKKRDRAPSTGAARAARASHARLTNVYQPTMYSQPSLTEKASAQTM